MFESLNTEILKLFKGHNIELRKLDIRYPEEQVRRRIISNTGIISDFSNKPYSEFASLPNIPCIFPYHPGTLKPSLKYDLTISFPITIKLDLTDEIKLKLPPKLREHTNLEIFLNVQNMPWDLTPNEPIKDHVLFRPHSWLHSDAPSQGVWNKKTLNVNCAFFKELKDCNNGIPNKQNLEFHTHTGDGGRVIYSPDKGSVKNFIPDLEKTTSFYSLVFVNNRAALTLHWMLNEKDYFALQQFVESKEKLDLKDIIKFIDPSYEEINHIEQDLENELEKAKQQSIQQAIIEERLRIEIEQQELKLAEEESLKDAINSKIKLLQEDLELNQQELQIKEAELKTFIEFAEFGEGPAPEEIERLISKIEQKQIKILAITKELQNISVVTPSNPETSSSSSSSLIINFSAISTPRPNSSITSPTIVAQPAASSSQTVAAPSAPIVAQPAASSPQTVVAAPSAPIVAQPAASSPQTVAAPSAPIVAQSAASTPQTVVAAPSAPILHFSQRNISPPKSPISTNAPTMSLSDRFSALCHEKKWDDALNLIREAATDDNYKENESELTKIVKKLGELRNHDFNRRVVEIPKLKSLFIAEISNNYRSRR